jgi:hypothetical protein
MNGNTRTIRAIRLTLLSVSMLASTPAFAQTAAGDVEFRATGYGYIPSLGGSMRFPTGGAATIDIESGTLLDNTNLALMGAFEVQKGRWGAFTDLMYFNVETTKTNTSEFELSGLQLPPGIAATASLDVKAWALTLAGNFRAVSSPHLVVDLFGGARMLKAKSELGWEFNTDFGPFAGPGRRGAGEADGNVWDGVGGIKGRVAFGERGLFIPYYADAGAGQSDLTWQAMAGVGYGFAFAEVVAVWRYLDYEMPADKRLETLDFNGPTIGVTFRW